MNMLQENQTRMNVTKGSGESITSTKNNGKKNGGTDRIKTVGKNDISKSINNNGNKNSRNKNNRKSSNANPKNLGIKSSKQEPQGFETTKSSSTNNNRCAKPKMVDSSTQTSTTLRLHLDGMFRDMSAIYERPNISSVESEYTEDEEGDEVISDIGVPSSPLSPRRSEERALFNSKELSCGYNLNFDWTRNSKKQHIFLPVESKPMCFQDIENYHERELLKLTDQLDALVTTVLDTHY